VDAPRARIAVLSAELADQIAAGEVVDRPASVVKELVENAVDAGARRVEIDLREAGLERILVCDDGHGMVAEDLPLAITRHATSKVRTANDLIEVATLGFRGEALASMAAVAHVTVESRPPDVRVGTRLRAHPGLPPELEPVAMSPGTRIEVARLFANVPARRKFLRSESTEVGHCSDTVLRLAISHPHVHLRLQHNGRVLLDLPGADLAARMLAVLQRRAQGLPERLEGTHAGVSVLALLAPVEVALRSRHGLFVVVRRRVVQQRELARIVEEAYGEALLPGRHPVACVIVEPPPGTVDVNVHPQKAEVRFSDPQTVYTAVRETLRSYSESRGAPTPLLSTALRLAPETSAALSRWESAGGPAVETAPSSSQGAYRLRTRATGADYAADRADLRAAAEAIGLPRFQGPSDRDPSPGAPPELPIAVPREEDPLQLLACLPGPVAVFRHESVLVAVDLLRLRSHLVYERLREDLGNGGRVDAQGLLEPVLIRRDPADVALVLASEEPLRRLGLVIEAFGDDAVRVRAVPARLRDCVEEPDVADLVARVVPWLRLHAQEPLSAARVLAQTQGPPPAPRLARRWLRELLERGAQLDAIPGVRRWTAAELCP